MFRNTFFLGEEKKNNIVLVLMPYEYDDWLRRYSIMNFKIYITPQ